MNGLDVKKIANEPRILRRWLVEQAKHTASARSAREFKRVAECIGEDAEYNKKAVESRARRKADAVGLWAKKGSEPFSKDNIGLFQLQNPRTGEVVAGLRFDMTANEVLSFCKNINTSVFECTAVPYDMYKRDPEGYWKIKEKVVDELFDRKLLDENGSFHYEDPYSPSIEALKRHLLAWRASHKL